MGSYKSGIHLGSPALAAAAAIRAGSPTRESFYRNNWAVRPEMIDKMTAAAGTDIWGGQRS
jgi:hypothetical protein